ncbi:MAG: hypothetical protein U0836_09280 [Pirellulales bacterium]
MAVKVDLVKRKLKAQPGRKAQYRYHLRWFENGVRHGETTGTGDKVQAESLLKRRWAELNGIVARPVAPEPDRPKFTWPECAEALERAMTADNLRPNSIASALISFDGLRRMFPDAASPADITPEMATEFKRRRSEAGHSPWTIRSDLSTLKATFGKWLCSECGFLTSNPFKDVKAPRCDDPEVRIVSAAEQDELFAWIAERWNGWALPATYLRVASLLGWRAMEIGSIREDDLLADGFVRVVAATSKTRRVKHGWLPPELYDALKACSSNGWAFGRFADELRRLLMLWKQQPNHAARVRKFGPERLVGWMQDELKRFNDEKAAAVAKARAEGNKAADWQPFTLHDFRRTAITGMQMAGVSEKEASVMVGATPEVIRKHYEKLDQQAIARRNVERRLGIVGQNASAVRQATNQGQPRLTTSDQLGQVAS